MIPFILAAVGGYLIGDSMKTKSFADGGKTDGAEDALRKVYDEVTPEIEYGTTRNGYSIEAKWVSKVNGKDVEIEAKYVLEGEGDEDGSVTYYFKGKIEASVDILNVKIPNDLYKEIEEFLREDLAETIDSQFDDDYYADGGKIESAAKFKADNPNWTNEKLLAEYNSLSIDLEDLKEGKITPRKVIGGGYKSSYVAKKIAKQWLEDRIAEYKMALEMRGVMADGGKISMNLSSFDSKKHDIEIEVEESSYYKIVLEIEISQGETESEYLLMYSIDYNNYNFSLDSGKNKDTGEKLSKQELKAIENNKVLSDMLDNAINDEMKKYEEAKNEPEYED